MMDQNSLAELTREIMAQGYDVRTASRYAALIGDLPLTDERGNIIVRDGKTVLATLKPLKMFAGQ